MLLKRVAAPRRMTIALTPLVDVVFILLFFFMLASSFDRSARMTMSVATPAANSAAQHADRVVVELDVDGDVRIAGRPVDAAALRHRLRDLGTHPEDDVVLRPHPEVALQALVTLIDQLDAAGVSGLQVQRMRQ